MVRKCLAPVRRWDYYLLGYDNEEGIHVVASIYFTDFFGVNPTTLSQYGAFNVSLVADLPLFIDPFLLFNSRNRVYQQLHEDIITYARFLRDRVAEGDVGRGSLLAWFVFSEVKQNWLGYSFASNSGSGLGLGFAEALSENLATVFRDFGSEQITQGSHIEKLCLIGSGVGRDHISDFTTNLIKEFLLDYTQSFARNFLRSGQRRKVQVERARFNYDTRTWQSLEFELPWHSGDYVLLTPRELLTRDKEWINRDDLVDEIQDVVSTIPNEQLRAEINQYFLRRLGEGSSVKERQAAGIATIRRYPVCIEYFIRYKEERGDEARATSEIKVRYSEQVFVERGQTLSSALKSTEFYYKTGDTYAEAHDRVAFLKGVIENQDGWKLFYVDGRPVRREKDLQLLFRLTWRGTDSDVNSEVNNGRGPVDYAVSRGRADKTIVEFKLASNPQLVHNLKHQVNIYEKASKAKRAIKVILFFTEKELARVEKILKDLNLSRNPDIVLIDGGEKVSASKATDASEVQPRTRRKRK